MSLKRLGRSAICLLLVAVMLIGYTPIQALAANVHIDVSLGTNSALKNTMKPESGSSKLPGLSISAYEKIAGKATWSITDSELGYTEKHILGVGSPDKSGTYVAVLMVEAQAEAEVSYELIAGNGNHLAYYYYNASGSTEQDKYSLPSGSTLTGDKLAFKCGTSWKYSTYGYPYVATVQSTDGNKDVKGTVQMSAGDQFVIIIAPKSTSATKQISFHLSVKEETLEQALPNVNAASNDSELGTVEMYRFADGKQHDVVSKGQVESYIQSGMYNIKKLANGELVIPGEYIFFVATRNDVAQGVTAKLDGWSVSGIDGDPVVVTDTDFYCMQVPEMGATPFTVTANFGYPSFPTYGLTSNRKGGTVITTWYEGATLKTKTDPDDRGGALYTEVDYDTRITFEAIPAEGYVFDGWYLWDQNQDDLILDVIDTEGLTPIQATGTKLEYTLATTTGYYPIAKFSQRTYSVGASVNDANMGAATATPSGTVGFGTSVTFKAEAKPGYKFDAWYNGDERTTYPAEYTTTVNGDLHLKAQFKADVFSVSAGYYTGCDASMGAVSVNPANQVAAGGTATFTATPASGYKFVAWYNGTSLVSIDTTYVAENVMAATNLTAKFEQINATVKFASDGKGGQFTVSGLGEDFAVTETSGQVSKTAWMNQPITLTATADTNYVFSHWLVDGAKNSNNPLATTVGEHASITAVWAADESRKVSFTVVPADKTMGAVKVNDNSYGSETTLTDFPEVSMRFAAEPKSGFHFVAWTKDGAVFSNEQEMTCTYNDVKNGKITAIFAPDTYKLTMPAVANGSYTLTVQGGTEAKATAGQSAASFDCWYDDAFVLTATPSGDDYKLVGWNVDGTVINSTELTYTLGKLEKAATVFPIFAEKYVTVTFPAVIGGNYFVEAENEEQDDRYFSVNNETVEFKALTDVRYVLTAANEYLYDFNEWMNGNASLGVTEKILVVEFKAGDEISPKFVSRAVTQAFPGVDGGGYKVSDPTGKIKTLIVTTDNMSYEGRNDKTYDIEAFANEGYHFVGWADENGQLKKDENGNVITSTKLSISLDLNAIIVPVFAPDTVIQYFPAVEGITYYIKQGDEIVATVGETDVFFAGRYDAEYTLAYDAANLKENYQFMWWADRNGTQLANSGETYSFMLNDAVIFKPRVKYFGSQVTLLPVIGSGSYTLNGLATPVTITDAAQQVECAQGGSYTLTATAASGYEFVGWKTQDGKLVSVANPYNQELPQTVMAVFAKTDSAKYSVNLQDYYFLDEAIDAADRSSAGKTIEVTRSGRIYSLEAGVTQYTIPAGVSLLVPHVPGMTMNNSGQHIYAIESQSSAWEGAGTNYSAPGDGNMTLQLTVPNGVTITVDGRMAVGGTTNGKGSIYGKHADVKLEGNAKIVVNGILSNCGFIHGSGSVEVNKTGKAYTPLSMDDFRGGGYTVGVAAKLTNETFDAYLNAPGGEAAIMPFTRYSIMGIQCRQVYHYGGELYGYADLFAGGSHNTTKVRLIGTKRSGDECALIALESSNATATITYNAGNTVAPYHKVGRTTITLDGNSALGGMLLSLNIRGVVKANIDSKGIVLPIPYNFEYVVNSGKLDLPNKTQLLPGATIRVNEGATLNVNSQLTVYNALNDWATVGYDWMNRGGNKTAEIGEFTRANGLSKGYNDIGRYSPYPYTKDLLNANYCGGGELIVNGTLNLNSGRFGGIVQSTSNTGKIVVASGVTTSTTTRLGAIGYWQYTILGAGFAFEMVGATTHTLPAQIADAATGQRIAMTAGKTYYSADLAEEAEAKNVVDSYKYTLYYAANGSTAYSQEITENVNIPMQGAWVDHAVKVIETDGTEKTVGYMIGSDVSEKDYYLDAEGTQKVTEITKEITTVYHIPTFTVTWMNGNSQLGASEVQINKPPAYPVAAEGEEAFAEPTKAGYAFIGWAADAAATTGTKLEDLAAVTEDIAYYAVFAKEYTITYNMNEGAWAADAVVPETYVVGSELTLPTAESLTREGWTFVGWYGNAAYTGDKLTEITADPAAHVDLYARWMQKVEAKDATCVADGNLAYWTDGSNNYKDEALTEQYEANGWIVKAEGHTPGAAADCENAQTCTVCNAELAPATGHSLTETAAEASTCTEAGNSAYWTCGTCGKYFSDAEGENKIEKDSWISELAAHNYEGDWDITDEGHARKCTACDAVEPERQAHADETTKDHKCDTCGYVMSVCSFTVKGEVVLEANCMTKAVYKAVCDVCEAVSETETITGEIDSTKHSYSAEWTTDGTEHWHICKNGCDSVSEKGAHTGGTASCTKRAECATCNAEYGELAKHQDVAGDDKHTCGSCDNTDKLSECADGNNDHNCDECGTKLTEHNYENGECIICGGADPNATAFMPTIGNGTTSDTTGENGTLTFKVGTADAAPEVTVTAPTNGWQLGENTFTVASTNDIACVVLVKNGDSYTRVSATTSGTTHSFKATLDENCEIVVAVKGDADANGEVNASDRMLIARAIYTDHESSIYKELSVLATIVCDVDGNGEINASDRMLLARAIYTDKESNIYKALEWDAEK